MLVAGSIRLGWAEAGGRMVDGGWLMGRIEGGSGKTGVLVSTGLYIISHTHS